VGADWWKNGAIFDHLEAFFDYIASDNYVIEKRHKVGRKESILVQYEIHRTSLIVKMCGEFVCLTHLVMCLLSKCVFIFKK